jgi:hypothetical protein
MPKPAASAQPIASAKPAASAKPTPPGVRPIGTAFKVDRTAGRPLVAGPRQPAESLPPAEPPRQPAGLRSQSAAAAAVPALNHAALPPIPQLTMHPAAAARPAGAERRRAPRMTLVAKATIRPDTPVQMPSLTAQGFVSNISMNGVGFHTRKPLETGGTYRISLELGPLKWACRFRVVSCRHHPESETFDCGGEFIGNELHRQMLLAA